eukprot:364224-Chlamydomonas_euryale.AAC.7
MPLCRGRRSFGPATPQPPPARPGCPVPIPVAARWAPRAPQLHLQPLPRHAACRRCLDGRPWRTRSTAGARRRRGDLR